MNLRRLAAWAAPVFAIAHALWWRGTGPVDDDYICYRYAQNLAAGEGLVFNVGERFEGFTTPLWVLLHGLWQTLGGSSPAMAVSVGCGAWVACVAWLAWRSQRAAESVWPAWWVAAAPAMAWHAHAGLGTTLMGLALLAAWLWRDRAPWRAGWALALACALRQEFVLFVVPLLWLESKERRLALCGPALGALALWTGFRLWYYGRWLPMTYDAKKLPVAADLEYGLGYFTDATWNLGWAGLLAVLLVRALQARDRQRTAWSAGVLLHSAYVVWVGGDFMVLSRFYVPVFPLLVAMVWPTQTDRRAVWLPALGLAGMLGMQWNQWGTHEESRSTRLLLQQGFKQRWARLGTHFGTHFPETTKVALSPIGAFSWASRLPVVDILGLTNDSVQGVEPNLEFIQVKGHHRSNFAWVMEQQPEFVILGNGVRGSDGRITINPWERDFYESLRAGGRFPQAYRQASMDVGDGMPLDVFIRRDQALPAGTRWVGP